MRRYFIWSLASLINKEARSHSRLHSMIQGTNCLFRLQISPATSSWACPVICALQLILQFFLASRDSVILLKCSFDCILYRLSTYHSCLKLSTPVYVLTFYVVEFTPLKNFTFETCILLSCFQSSSVIWYLRQHRPYRDFIKLRFQTFLVSKTK